MNRMYTDEKNAAFLNCNTHMPNQTFTMSVYYSEFFFEGKFNYPDLRNYVKENSDISIEQNRTACDSFYQCI